MKPLPPWTIALPFAGLALVLAAHYAPANAVAMGLRVAGIALCVFYFAVRGRMRKR